MRKPRTVRRALLGLTTAVALTGGSLIAPSAGVAATKPHPRAVAGTTWLTGQLNQQMPFQQWGYASWGPTLDAYFAFDELGVRSGQRDRVLDTLETDVESYVNMGGDVAGAIAKTLSAVQADGRDEASYAGGDLLTRLEAQVEPSGDEAGRVHEYYDDGTTVTDYANTLDQAWAARALAGADSEHEDTALGFLLRQQCAGGGFRQDFEPSDTCAPNVDVTALAVLSILEARRAGVDVPAATVKDSLQAAARWLVTVQRRNGSFTGADGISTDSTGLAARALLALGRARPADDAAEWVKRQQVTAKMARRTKLRRADVGALAPTPAALQEAKRTGIADESRINWQLATAQATPGLDALIPG